MILQALSGYYRRKSAVGEIAPEGFEYKEITHVIVLKPSGEFVQLDDMREMADKKKRGKIYLAPKSVKRTAGILSNLLWDNSGYVLGIDVKETLTPTPAKQQAFIANIEQLLATDLNGDETAVRAVLTFLQSQDYAALFATLAWQEILTEQGNPPSVNLTFRLAGESELVCQCERVRCYIQQSTDATENKGMCLISGEQDQIERIHPSIKGVWGAQSSGAAIVSFNFDAAEFYGKKQGDNAPIGKKTAFAYTTALNHLLSSKQRIQIGDASTIFWAEQSTQMEDIFGNILGNDDPDRNIEAVKALYHSLHTGAWTELDQENRFYLLGLAPNAARIVIRFWHVTTVKHLATQLQQYFTDLQIIHSADETDYLPLWRIQAGFSSKNDKKSNEKNSPIIAQLLHSIVTGAPFSYAILVSLIARIGAEREIKYPRAALLKAWLNRDARSKTSIFLNSSQEEITMALDETNTQLGYRLGRLFAVLEKIQEEGGGKNIRERFYRAASSTPLVIFPHLFSLKNYHLAKLENKGRAVNLEKSIGQIISGIPADLPAVLDIKDQARFAIGYYHQRQHFFTASQEKETAASPIPMTQGV